MRLPWAPEVKTYGLDFPSFFSSSPVTAERVVVLCLPAEAVNISAILSVQVVEFEIWDIAEKAATTALLDAEISSWIARLITKTTRIGPPDLTPLPAKVSLNAMPIVVNKNLTVSVGRETKGRAGKGVTLIFDLPLNYDQILELAAKLKQKCGTGGTVKEGKIEIQGDQRERIILELEKLGFKSKKVGG